MQVFNYIDTIIVFVIPFTLIVVLNTFTTITVWKFDGVRRSMTMQKRLERRFARLWWKFSINLNCPVRRMKATRQMSNENQVYASRANYPSVHMNGACQLQKGKIKQISSEISWKAIANFQPARPPPTHRKSRSPRCCWSCRRSSCASICPATPSALLHSMLWYVFAFPQANTCFKKPFNV